MEIHDAIQSKVLVHEFNAQAERELKQFFQTKGLIGLKDPSSTLLDLLEGNSDLGGVFLALGTGADQNSVLELGLEIHRRRPELPIFLRREDNDQSVLPADYSEAFSGSYSLSQMDALSELVDGHLFSRFYPVPLIRGIQEISQQAFCSSIKGIHALSSAPYLVKDQIIYGELFSLIPLESAWCRGFMMLQTTENEILKMISAGKTNLYSSEVGFRDVNGLLSEITNLIWGGIKSRFFADEAENQNMMRTQVPIMVNHKEKYISFGTQEPQLCFRYVISDLDNVVGPIEVYQKLIFNLSWSPEAFREASKAIDDLVDAGELEFF